MKKLGKLFLVVFGGLVCLILMLVGVEVVARQQPPATVRSVRMTGLEIRNDWQCLKVRKAQHKVIAFVANRSGERVEGVKVAVELYKINGIFWKNASKYLGDFEAYETKSFEVTQLVAPGIEIGKCELRLLDQDNTLLNFDRDKYGEIEGYR